MAMRSLLVETRDFMNNLEAFSTEPHGSMPTQKALISYLYNFDSLSTCEAPSYCEPLTCLQTDLPFMS